jgi:cell division septal protein FtsQ
MSNAQSAYGGSESAGYRKASLLNSQTEPWADGPAARNPRIAAARWARPVLIALSAVCGLVLVGRFIGEPLMQIRHVTVHSDVALADDQVLALSGIQSSEHWYTVSTAAIQKRLEASPLIRRAVAEKVFPETIRLTLWGRQPAALVLASSGGRSFPVLVDDEGVVFKVATAGDLDLPVVSGLSAGTMALGAQLPRAYRALFADLRAIRQKAPAMCAALSEIRVVGDGAADLSPQDLELVIYLASTPVPIRTRGSIDEGLVRYGLMAVDLLSRQGVLKDIQELDFRSGDVVYRRAGNVAPAPASADYRGAESADYRGAGSADYRGAGSADYRGAGSADYRGAGSADYRGAVAAAKGG